MKKTIYLILKEDIVYYPPVLSIINVLLDLNIQVVHIGVYSDEIQKSNYEKAGVVFLSTINYDGKANLINKFHQQLKYRKQVENYLKNRKFNKGDLIWMFQAETVCLLSNLVKQYPTIIQPFEFFNPIINWKYKLLNPTFNMGVTMRRAKAIVTCEYNRSQITKGIFSLKELPYVLPNKPYLQEKESTAPIEVNNIIREIESKAKGRKIILYQGVFTADRKLDEFCEALMQMSDKYVLLLMGKTSLMYEQLKMKYISDNIIFIPFIQPPYHLLVTQICSIGILTYFPGGTDFANVINPLYCAPNKIFEYGKFGKPMLANDIPGLKYIFKEFNCGECIQDPINIADIKSAINKIFANYDSYVSGSKEYYSSIDLKAIINKIISSI